MGIPVVVVTTGGLAITESTNGLPMTEATNGFGIPVRFVTSGGLPVSGIVSGPSIQLSASSVAENAAISTVVGTLSVINGTGTYTFTLTDNAGGKFVLGGTNNSSLRTAALLDYETASSHTIAVSATNGVTPIAARNFTITVTDILETVYTLTMGSGSFALTGSAMEILEIDAPSYIGPGDVAGYSGAYAYWGLRAYNAAYAATLGPLADLTRNDAATMTLNCLATGAHDAATLNAWMAGHTAKVTKLYNQAGTGTGRDLLGFSATRSPVLTMSGVGLGSVPCMYFDYSGDSPFMISASNSTVLAQPLTYSTIVRFNTFAGNTAIFSDGTFGIQAYSNATTKIVPYAGSFATPSNYSMVADDSWGSLQMVYSGGASSVNSSNVGFNSSGTPTTVGTSINTNGFDGTAKLALGSMTEGGTNYMNGYVFEFMVLPSAVNAANQALQVANQRLYGGGF